MRAPSRLTVPVRNGIAAQARAGASARTRVKHLGITADVDVTCMAVEGNAAFIAGVIRKATSPPRPDGTPLVRKGTVAYFWTVNNGEGTVDGERDAPERPAGGGRGLLRPQAAGVPAAHAGGTGKRAGAGRLTGRFAGRAGAFST